MVQTFDEMKKNSQKVETKIMISAEQLEKIQKFVQEGRFESFEDFVEQALNLLLYAEERKDDFEKILSM